MQELIFPDRYTRKRDDDNDLTKIRVGQIVRVRDDAGNEANYKVKYAPWQLGHGAWVIGLAGISGGYSLDRVVAVVGAQRD